MGTVNLVYFRVCDWVLGYFDRSSWIGNLLIKRFNFWINKDFSQYYLTIVRESGTDRHPSQNRSSIGFNFGGCGCLTDGLSSFLFIYRYSWESHWSGIDLLGHTRRAAGQSEGASCWNGNLQGGWVLVYSLGQGLWLWGLVHRETVGVLRGSRAVRAIGFGSFSMWQILWADFRRHRINSSLLPRWWERLANGIGCYLSTINII